MHKHTHTQTRTQVLNLEGNRLEDPSIVDLLAQLPNLKCLYLKGNECVKKIRHYRKVNKGLHRGDGILC